MKDGFYEIYEISHGLNPKRIAVFKDIDNVRIYLEANCPNLNEIQVLEIHGHDVPRRYNNHKWYYEYVPITQENAHEYEIGTEGHIYHLKVKYIEFDD